MTTNNWITTTLYTYDADGKRARKRVVENGETLTTTEYVGSWMEVTNGVTTTYYSLGSQRVAVRQSQPEPDGELTFLHSDHLGSTSAWTGSETGRQAYYPYGMVRASEGELPTDVTFTGQRIDRSTAQNGAGTGRCNGGSG